MKKKKIIMFIVCILISTCFIFLGMNFSNTNKIAEEIGLENFKNFSIGTAKQFENILPQKDKISIFNIGYKLNDEIGLSFFSISRLALLSVFTYQLINIFSKNKKIKIIGMLGIAFSSLVLLDFSNRIIDIIIFSEMILVASENILYNQKNKLSSYFLAIVMIISCASIVLLYEIELILCSLFITIPILIYILMKYKDKSGKKLFTLTLAIGIILATVIVIMNFPNINTQLKTEKRYISHLLGYVNTTFLGFKNVNYLSDYANIYSLFPLPIVLATILTLRSDKKENNFLFIILLVSTWLIIGACTTFSTTMSKILLVGFISNKNLSILINFFSLICLLYMIEKSEMEINISKAVTIIMITVILTVFAKRPAELNETLYLIISAGIYSIIGYILCRKDDKKYKKVLMNILIIYMAIIGISQVNISFGSDVLKLEAVELFENIEIENSRWIVLDNNYIIPEYLENCGATVINTNINQIDKYKFRNSTKYKEDELWLFYQEAIFKIDDENVLGLTEENILQIGITEEYLDDLKIDYILSGKKIDGQKEVYKNDKIFIYKY